MLYAKGHYHVQVQHSIAVCPSKCKGSKICYLKIGLLDIMIILGWLFLRKADLGEALKVPFVKEIYLCM